ncbi:MULTISPECIES: glutathione S-transferase family protein [Pseudomonadota]|uniref:glutathione S-transferase family protein n=1 Tax=Pseudomonadota TaxID=1224 RepID=UPI00272422B0|nr:MULTISPECIES: glutathione S-transferase family protein [Pseudomonadota]MDO9127702.1 glutathione S-transferase family protein [Parvibaculum sp.]MDP1627631.1 glutathione S-transferase family protein [Parvibaculum sp.]MDP2243733.1 glutathione S-transferase family protein [Pseudomonas sp.]MDP3328666.1 glutathione S-transferase family protein [Parvibaculum sp.]
MKLYNSAMPAPNPRRVRIFAAEKGIDLPLEEVALAKREHKSDAFREKNSLGQTPVLELDDGTTISESVSICRYLEETYPEKPLFGRTALERAQVDMWLRRVEFALMGPIGNFWRHAHPYTAKVVKQFNDFGESNREAATAAFRWLDRELAGREFLAGDYFSAADITALCTVDFADFAGLKMPEDAPNLRAWHARVSQRPSAAA